MKIKYLGTAAAEGIPALFCNCPICTYAREHRKREVRTRSQALIDDKLLIDFPADSYKHALENEVDLSAISHLLITHSHDDHFYPMDLFMRHPEYGKKWGAEQLHIYGNSAVICLLKEMAERFSVEDIWEYIVPHEIKPFDVLEIENYRITALPARHMQTEEALLFLIEKEDTAFLYGNDTGIPGEEFWKGLKGTKLNGASMDCTMGKEKSKYHGHMGFGDILEVKERMEKEGAADQETAWVVTHFSHNGGWTYERMTEDLKDTVFQAAFDGMCIEIGK